MSTQYNYENPTPSKYHDAYPMNGNLKRMREFLALSRRELASLSGVNESTIYRAEHGMTTLRPSTIQKLARALGIAVTEITKSDGSSDSAPG